MSAIDSLFEQLRSEKRKALMPFVTAGDPDIAFTGEVLREMARRDASMFEVGVPYSDPIADGPVIQESYTRALDKGLKLSDILQMLGEVTPSLPAPVVTMVSYAIIYRRGPEAFLAAAKKAGVAGCIVPDLPLDEAEELSKLCQKADLSLIQLVTPTTPRERALRIAATSTGFLYYVSVAGITGERKELPPELIENVSWLREQTDLPICIGFGISQPEHAKLLAPVADGLIVGSAVVRRVAEAAVKPRAAVLNDVGAYVESLLAAMGS